MRNYKSLSLPLAALLVFSAAYITTPSGRGQQGGAAARAEREKDDAAPVAVYDAPEPAGEGERARRRAKSEKYDGMNLVREQPADIIIVPRSSHWSSGLKAIPVAQGDLVVVGQVFDAQAYLSNNKKGVYSEFGVRLDAVLKNDKRSPVSPGETITVERAGGSVRFPSGSVQRFRVYSSQRMPQLGRRYLFFLGRGRGADGWTIVTGYELSEGRVVALDTTRKFSDHDGTAEDVFIKSVKDAISAPASPETDQKGGVNQ